VTIVDQDKPDDSAQIRILSLDGSGIYGLATARWLRALCERDEAFLSEGNIDLFAGCSSGAINALLLAKYQRPRDAVLAGELEEFWRDADTFANGNPMEAWASMLGFGPWFATRDFLRVLRRYFGDMRFYDLEQWVLISTFNWTGQRSLAPNETHGGRFWRPKYFKNFRVEHPDVQASVADVAYGAAAPPIFREIREGIGDGAAFTANPAVAAITDAIWHAFAIIEYRAGLTPERREAYRRAFATSSSAIDHVSVLSLGSGQRIPSYWRESMSLGFMEYPLAPTNPNGGVWYPPSAYSLDPAAEEATYICESLIHERFLRLNPQVFDLPTVTATWVARFPAARDWVFSQIEAGTTCPEATRAVDRAAAFLKNGWHNDHFTRQRINEPNWMEEWKAAEQHDAGLGPDRRPDLWVNGRWKGA
jgi:hypothetical protein